MRYIVVIVFMLANILSKDVFSQVMYKDTLPKDDYHVITKEMSFADSVFYQIRKGSYEGILSDETLDCFFKLERIKGDIEWFTNKSDNKKGDYNKSVILWKEEDRDGNFKKITSIEVNFIMTKTEDELRVSIKNHKYCVEVIRAERDKRLIIPLK